MDATQKTCRFCGQPITAAGRMWVDGTGSPTCAIKIHDCLDCDDGEQHPHAPHPDPARVHVLFILDLPAGSSTSPEALLPDMPTDVWLAEPVYDLVLDHTSWVCALCGCSELRYVETMAGAWDIRDATAEQIVAMGPYETEGFDELGYDGHIECDSCCARHRIPTGVDLTFT